MRIVRARAVLFMATLLVGCGGSTFTAPDAGGSPSGDASGTDAHGGHHDAGHANDTGAPGHDAGTSKDGGTKHDSGGVNSDAGSPDGTSGSDGASPDAGADGGADSGTDAGVDSGSTVCPASVPTAGLPCSMNDLECEYGSDPSPACDTVVTCDGASWTVDHGPASTGCNTTNSATCPAAYTDATGSCSPSGLSCDYPEARCTCGIAPPLAMTEWICNTPFESGCPLPRPRLGSTCSMDGQSCDYGGCTGGVNMECAGGTWVQTGGVCPG